MGHGLSMSIYHEFRDSFRSLSTDEIEVYNRLKLRLPSKLLPELTTIVLDMFGRILPILKLKDRTDDYINYIEPSEITAPIMVGQDVHKRPFVTIRGNITFEDDTKRDFFQIFFQRYTDTKYCWQSSGYYQDLVNTVGDISLDQYVLVTLLIRNGKFIVTKEDKRYYRFINGTTASDLAFDLAIGLSHPVKKIIKEINLA